MQSSGTGSTTIVNHALSMVVFVIALALFLPMHFIALGTALKDQNGPQIQSGAWQVVGGGLIVAAAQLFNNIAVA